MASPGYWLSTVAPAPSAGPLLGRVDADVAVIGAGYTGLWTALELTGREPSLRVVVCEADEVGYGASGRNGGFCEPSLTHGLLNGLAHFPDEIDELQRLAAENDAGLRAFLAREAISCDFEPTGILDVAVADWQVDDLREYAAACAAHGEAAELLDAAAARAELDSPMFVGALYRPRAAILNPAKLVRELARVAAGRRVAVHEHSPVLRVARHGTGVEVRTPTGTVRAAQAVLATNAYSHRLLRRTGRHFVPVYDYVVVSEPLTTEQLAAVGWKRRQGVADGGNQFHYYRLTADNRILWGGYDAVYHYGSALGGRYDRNGGVFQRLEAHFRQAFPQLAGVRFSHRWGGAIATTTRFTPVFGRALGGRVAYALGYTGLGVATTRFAARVLGDMLLDPASGLLSLRYVSHAPFPFPPEPLRWPAVTVVRRAVARADRRAGRRGPVLQALDRCGIGFDS